MRLIILLIALMQISITAFAAVGDASIRIKELCRLSSAVDNKLVGYGLVTGLAGTGDSARSGATVQSIKNSLLRLGANVNSRQIRSRNVAVVSITATLYAFAQPGDKLDVNVTSMGDARSLVGGTLLLSHLTGPDGKIYALAQGPVSVGGFQYDFNGNLVQKNHPTAGNIPGGATVEKDVNTSMVDNDGFVNYSLYNPDITTASRVTESLNRRFGAGTAHALNAGKIRISLPVAARDNPIAFLTQVESISITPDRRSKIVINERTGTVVSGGNVIIDPVSITHGDLMVNISTEFSVSQPGFVTQIRSSGISTEVVPNTKIEVKENKPMSLSLRKNSNVMDLVAALNRVKASSRDIITVLQAIKRAGALHAELIIQ